LSGGRDLAATRLLADVGRLLEGDAHSGAGERRSPEERLIALAARLDGVFGDGVVVSLVGPDGRARRLAVAHDDPAVERALLGLAPSGIPPALAALLEPGDPVLVPVTAELNREAARDEPDARRRDALGARAVFLVPLVVDAELVGIIGFLHLADASGGDGDGGVEGLYDDLDRAVAGEIGRRAALMLGSERRREQERQLRAVAGDLASAHGTTDAARLLVQRLSEALGADAGSVFLRVPDRRELRMVHGEGYSEPLLRSFSRIRFDDPVPLGLAARTGEPVWIRDRDEWERRWPALLPHTVAAGRHAAATIPLHSGGELVGLLGLSFATPRVFGAAERRFVLELVDRAAPALERAAAADERRRIADTLQRSLLPRELPVLDGLGIAARYRPGARGTQTGGDWYDVVPLDGDRVALVVGDVVGQGAGAAAVMGQLRSALAAYLLEGHEPARAVALLDRFSDRVPQALGSTVVCVVVDPGRGELRWARAGHPHPLVTGPGGARFLDADVGGTVLGVRRRGAVPPFGTGTAPVGPGDTVVLYTDGLVERRDRVVDEGLDRVRSAAADGHALGPDALADALLGQDDARGGPVDGAVDGRVDGAVEGRVDGAVEGRVDGAVVGRLDRRHDDVALLVVRLLPAPLELAFRADGALLRGVRRRIDGWAHLAGIDPDTAYDLQLAAGEAMANAVEHAYTGQAVGDVVVRLVARGDGGVAVEVHDGGRWLDPPVDPGYRGRGLALVHHVGREVRVAHGEAGTSVAFVVPRAAGATAGPPVAAPAAATRLRTDPGPGTRIHVLGDLDLAGVEAVRAELVGRCGDGDGVGDVEVDLRAVPYLASAGVALLRDAARAARGAGRALRVRAHPGSGVGRVLTLAGAGSELGLDGG
jgi:GAF domain-containing protein/anti-sigma regulatory factor (Ser/Thr protein kinase)/anti-anti-sigma regulatory factor